MRFIILLLISSAHAEQFKFINKSLKSTVEISKEEIRYTNESINISISSSSCSKHIYDDQVKKIHSLFDSIKKYEKNDDDIEIVSGHVRKFVSERSKKAAFINVLDADFKKKKIEENLNCKK